MQIDKQIPLCPLKTPGIRSGRVSALEVPKISQAVFTQPETIEKVVTGSARRARRQRTFNQSGAEGRIICVCVDLAQGRD